MASFLSFPFIPTHLLGRVFLAHFFVPVGGAAHAQGGGLAGHVVAVPGGGNRVEAHRVGLAVLGVGAGGDHAEGLAFPVRDAALGVDHDVACLTGGLRAHDALHRHDFAHVWVLYFVFVSRRRKETASVTSFERMAGSKIATIRCTNLVNP